jgi:hypothetical protein
MALRLNGSTSGYVEIDAPAVAGDNTLALPSTPNGSLVALDSSGKLLVGTDTAPSAVGPLQIVDTVSSVLVLARNDTSISAGNSVGEIRFYSNDSTAASYEQCATIAASADGTFADGDKPTRLVFSTTADGASSPTERLRIDSSGRVGIGITSPASALHVVTSGAGEIRHADGARAVAMGSTGTISYIGSITAGNGLALYSANEEKARIDASGRLLVGASSGNGSVSLFQIVGNTGGNTGAQISLSRGAIPTAVSQTIGLIAFGDGSGDTYAEIKSQCDGTAAAGDAPGRLVFSTTADGASTPTERMRISNNGTVWIGKTGIDSPGLFDTSANLKLYSNSSTTSGAVALESQNNSTALRYHFVFSNANGIVGSISTNASATAYTTSSDYRLKENVTAVTDGITRLQQLKPSRFNFIADPDKTVDGFIAHEVQAVVPEAITGEKDAVDDEGNPQYQGIDQSKLVPLLTAALQEAIAKIESLEARITALEVTP